MRADNLSGNVQTAGYENWIEAQHFTYPGITNSLETVVGKTSDRINRRPDFSEVVITKNADLSSIYLFEYAFTGQVIDAIDIHFVSTGNPPETYEMWHLKNVLISHCSTEHDAHQTSPTEIICLNYTSIQRTYKAQMTSSGFSNPIISGYDLASAKKM